MKANYEQNERERTELYRGNQSSGILLDSLPPFTPLSPVKQWRRISSGAPGQKTFNFVNPNPSSEGDFIFLDAKDTDGDGLSDGYEGWFTYDGEQTRADRDDTNLDRMRDGWKVLYGLDPLDTSGVNDPEYTVSGDTLSSEDKHERYYTRLETLDLSYASYDPLHVAETSSVRPVLRLAPSGESAFNVASFTITRDVGSGGSLSSALTVYYAVGGTLKYGVDFDYILDPAPIQVHYPGVFSVEIPPGQASVIVSVILIRDSIPVGDKNVILTLTPFDTVE